MKKLITLSSLLVLMACGKSGEHTGHDMDKDHQDDPNQALYNQVMSIHDEVMPKMEDLYKMKRELNDKIANTKDLTEEKKKEIEMTIASLDSASNAMMDWMHEFNPMADTVDQEAAREYLETEMERIMKVRDLTNETLEKAKPFPGKN